MKFIIQTKFWQLPVELRLIVLLFLFFSISSFWKFGIYIKTESTIELGPLIRGIIELLLATGLINRSNEARHWAAFVVFLNLLASIFFLTVAVFQDQNQTTGFNISFNQFSQSQTIAFLVIYFILCIIILLILLGSKTKEFFKNDES